MTPTGPLETYDWPALKSDLLKIKAESPGKAEFMEGIGKRFSLLPSVVLVWVGLIENTTRTVIPIFEVGAFGAYLDKNKFTFDDSRYGAGPVGRAIRTRLPAFMNDIHNDPTFEPWRKRAESYGFASCATLPLMPAGILSGVLTLYSSMGGAFPDAVQGRIGEIARLIAE